jgi:hypothetical protein
LFIGRGGADAVDQLTPVRLDDMARQTRFMFLAWAVLLAAIVGLYGTVIAIVR